MEYRDRWRVPLATQSAVYSRAAVLRMKLDVIQLRCTEPLSNERMFLISMLFCIVINDETKQLLTIHEDHNHWKFELTLIVFQLVSNRIYRIDATAWATFYLN